MSDKIMLMNTLKQKMTAAKYTMHQYSGKFIWMQQK